MMGCMRWRGGASGSGALAHAPCLPLIPRAPQLQHTCRHATRGTRHTAAAAAAGAARIRSTAPLPPASPPLPPQVNSLIEDAQAGKPLRGPMQQQSSPGGGGPSPLSPSTAHAIFASTVSGGLLLLLLLPAPCWCNTSTPLTQTHAHGWAQRAPTQQRPANCRQHTLDCPPQPPLSPSRARSPRSPLSPHRKMSLGSSLKRVRALCWIVAVRCCGHCGLRRAPARLLPPPPPCGHPR